MKLGFLEPASGRGQQWFQTIEEVERTFNAKFAGWALDVGGLYVAWPKGVPYLGVTPAPAPKPIPVPAPDPIIPEEDDEMATPIYVRDAATKGQGSIFLVRAVDGKRRVIPTPEWNARRAAHKAAGEAVTVVDMSADDLKKIPTA